MRAVKCAGARPIGAPPGVRLTLILIDDHAIVRDGVRALLEAERDLEVIAEAATLAEGIALVKRLRPDIVIIDISFPAGDGIEAIGTLRRECEDVTIVVLTVHNTPECMHAAMSAGADKFVTKHAAYEILSRAIRSPTSRNVRTAHSRPIARPHGALSMRRHVSPMRSLTLRERQVLIGIAQGYNSKQIAAKLERSVKTIVKHRSNMMRKLSLHDASAVTRFAVANGLLSP
jgi:DNA-binding NarL/FixJ family response regulator